MAINLTLLKKPLSLQELKAQAKNGRISVNIVISLEDLLNYGIEDLNDLADTRILNVAIGASLSDINYKVVGVIPAKENAPGCLNGEIIINVNADVSDII
jgi:hypothetical protein